MRTMLTTTLTLLIFGNVLAAEKIIFSCEYGKGRSLLYVSHEIEDSRTARSMKGPIVYNIIEDYMYAGDLELSNGWETRIVSRLQECTKSDSELSCTWDNQKNENDENYERFINRITLESKIITNDRTANRHWQTVWKGSCEIKRQAF